MRGRFVLLDREPLIELNPDIVENIKGLCDFGLFDENACWLMRPTSRNEEKNKYSHRSVRVDQTGARTQFYTHRISWVLQYGSIDPGKQIRHQCHNTLCINPSHLELGTAKGNAFDRVFRNLVMRWFGNRPAPELRFPHISLWPGWNLPEYQDAYERVHRLAEAGAAADAAE